MTTDSYHGEPIAHNLLDQDFTCDGPDPEWSVDISYVWTAEGWLYLAVVVAFIRVILLDGQRAIE